MTSRREYAFGLFMALVWLPFLFFPLQEIATEPYSPTLRISGYTLLTLFAVVYSGTWIVALTDRMKKHLTRVYATAMVVLLALAIALVALFSALGFATLPYMGSLTGMLLPLQPSSIIIGLLTVAVELLGWWLGVSSPAHGFIIIMIGVYAMTAGSRYFEQAAREKQTAIAHEAMSTERNRVARDVHDVVGHSLTVISLKSQLAVRLLDSDTERARAELLEISDLTRAAIAEVRATVSGLRMQLLADELANATEVLADAKIPVTVTGAVDDVDPRFRFVFSWVVREAVTNILRHAHASHVAITIAPSHITISDDGVGISRAHGNGLTGLAERIADAGGRLDVVATNPGTSVTAVMDVRTRK